MFPRDDKVLNGFLLEVMMVLERAKAQYLTYFRAHQKDFSATLNAFIVNH
jgi:hypothetical protein